MTETTCVSHYLRFSFFSSSSSYTRMMRDRIESHERMRESVCAILTCQTQCLQRLVLLQCLRNRLCTVVSDLVACFIHENKKRKKMNVKTKKSQKITSKQHQQHKTISQNNLQQITDTVEYNTTQVIL